MTASFNLINQTHDLMYTTANRGKYDRANETERKKKKEKDMIN